MMYLMLLPCNLLFLGIFFYFILITESALAGVGKRQLLALCEQFYDSLNICRITPTESSMGGENL